MLVLPKVRKAAIAIAVSLTANVSGTSFAQEFSGDPGAAAESPAAASHSRARLAGLQALHLCTGIFTSEMTEETVRSSFQPGTRPQEPIREIIDRARKTVSVAYTDGMPPRIAVWRPHQGCTQLPIGATEAAAASLNRFPAGVAPPALDKMAWPLGDAKATGRLNATQRKTVASILDTAFADEAGDYKGQTWGVVILKDGKIVAERYDPGFGPHIAARTNSMCKSLSVTLVGAGVHQGLLNLEAPAPLSEWRRAGDPRGAITLDHMLRMASGLYTTGDSNPQPELYGAGAPAYEVSALNVMNNRPGETFVYAGSDTILATRALRQAVANDTDFAVWPYRELLWKLGMTRTVIETDWNNDFLISGQCWSTARDFARLGQLYLDDGVWNGERLLPEGWSNYVSTAGPAQPSSRFLADSKYGAQFWIYDNRDGLPGKAYAAAGAFGQYAMIVPSENLVVVRRGLDGREGFAIARFAADVAAALR